MRSPIRAWRNRFKISQDIRPLHGCGSCLAHQSGQRIQSPAIVCKRLGRAVLRILSSEKFLTELLHREICDRVERLASCKVRATDIRSDNFSSIKVRSAKICATGVRAVKVHLTGVRLTEICFAEICLDEIRNGKEGGTEGKQSVKKAVCFDSFTLNLLLNRRGGVCLRAF
jgi:hypothetical protein